MFVPYIGEEVSEREREKGKFRTGVAQEFKGRLLDGFAARIMPSAS